MSFLYHFNLQVVCLEIAQMHLNNMTNENMQCEFYANENKLANNIKHGVAVIIMLCTAIENSLNFLLVEKIKDKKQLNKILYFSTEEKLKKIYGLYNCSINDLENSFEMKTYQNLKKLRNHLVHFKNNLIGNVGGIFLEWRIWNYSATEFFTKNNMQLQYDIIINLLEKIATDLKLNFNKGAPIFGFNGSGEPVSFLSNSYL